MDSELGRSLEMNDKRGHPVGVKTYRNCEFSAVKETCCPLVNFLVKRLTLNWTQVYLLITFAHWSNACLQQQPNKHNLLPPAGPSWRLSLHLFYLVSYEMKMPCSVRLSALDRISKSLSVMVTLLWGPSIGQFWDPRGSSWVVPAPVLESAIYSKRRLSGFDPSLPLSLQAVLMVGNGPALLASTNQPFANNIKSSLALVRCYGSSSMCSPACLPSLLPNGFPFAQSHFLHSLYLDWCRPAPSESGCRAGRIN